MSLLTILDRLSGFIYPIYLLRGQWTAWAMLVPLPKDQISDRWNEWNMKRGGTMWNGETCNLVHSSWLPARPQIAVRKHGSLPCVPCVPGVPGVPRGLARLLSLVSLSLTPSVPQLRNCACQLFHGTSWTRIKQWIMNNPNVSSLRITIQVLPSIWQKKTVCLQKQPPQCKVHLEAMKNEEKHFWDKHLKTVHKTLYLLSFWFIRYFWDVKTFQKKKL